MKLNKTKKDIEQKIQLIRFLLSDVDGVLTDGSLYVGSDGVEYKKFHVEDHAGIALCYFGGINTGFLSARFSETTSIRAKEMKVKICEQGVLNKAKKMLEICKTEKIKQNEIAYVGDGLIDIPVMEKVGLAITVSDADERVKDCADIITDKSGGEGVLKEIAYFILSKQNKLDDTLEKMRKNIYES